MAKQEYETSKDRGQPVELYKFVFGTTPGAYYAYTSAEKPIIHDDGDGPITYEPLAIDRTKIKSSGNLQSRELSITVPRSAEIADLYRIYPPSRVVTCTMRQGHIANPDDPAPFLAGEMFPVAWVGRVLEASRTGPTAELVCEALGAGMKRPGLRRHYQWPCPLALYGSRCGADKVAATTTIVLQSFGTNTLTFLDGWHGVLAASGYIGGIVEWTGLNGQERRTIIRISGTDSIVLNGPVRDLTALDDIEVSLGCPHTLHGCDDLHSNAINYGGHPYIPTLNPVHKNNHS